jgi:hypothetical protein
VSAGRSLAAALAVLPAAALIAACGGSDEGDTKTAPPDGDRAASRRFVRELDALCERADRLAARAQAHFDQVKSEASSSREAARGTARIIARLEPRVAGLERELRMVEVPPAERGFAARYIELTEEIGNLLAASRVAAEKNDAQTFQGLTQRSEALVAERDRLVERHGGFRSCGES